MHEGTASFPRKRESSMRVLVLFTGPGFPLSRERRGFVGMTLFVSRERRGFVGMTLFVSRE